jgi:hypothetical protein
MNTWRECRCYIAMRLVRLLVDAQPVINHCHLHAIYIRTRLVPGVDPFERLPNELLIMILRSVRPRGAYNDTTIQLGGVSRRWRSAAIYLRDVSIRRWMAALLQGDRLRSTPDYWSCYRRDAVGKIRWDCVWP